MTRVSFAANRYNLLRRIVHKDPILDPGGSGTRKPSALRKTSIAKQTLKLRPEKRTTFLPQPLKAASHKNLAGGRSVPFGWGIGNS
jgi:hypothetical protein